MFGAFFSFSGHSGGTAVPDGISSSGGSLQLRGPTMRIMSVLIFTLGLGWLVGCNQQHKTFDGPTVDAFNGKLVHNGKSVTLPNTETVELKLIYEKGDTFGVPIKSDGSFQIGWMPIGKYTAMLIREKNQGASKGGPNMYTVPGGFEIVSGKTEYEVELGKNWKP
jgi:hypothetical protein